MLSHSVFRRGKSFRLVESFETIVLRKNPTRLQNNVNNPLSSLPTRVRIVAEVLLPGH